MNDGTRLNNHITDLLPAYALDCLDEDELDLVSQHLSGCPACREDLRAYQEVAGQLPLAVPLVAPPGSVRASLLARVEAETRTNRPPEKARHDRWPALRRWISGISPAWGLAALLLVIGLGVGNLLLARRLAQVVEAVPAMEVVNLLSEDDSSNANGVIIISQDGEYGSLVVENLAPLPPEQQYQLWLIRDGERASGGVFSVNSEGYAGLGVNSPVPLAEYSAFGITIEPAGGSPGPTGDKVLGGEIY